MTIAELKRIVGAKLLQGEGNRSVGTVRIDSRLVKRRDLFVAIKGERLNGHRFIEQALRHGASAVLVSKRTQCPSRVSVLLVKDTAIALGKIASYRRQRFAGPVIGVTGSTGKTTTKELIAAVLQKRLTTLKSQGSYNNHIGVPLTLLQLTQRHQAVVLELGSNQAGDISYLTKMTQPTVAVLTNIGSSHLQGLKSERGVLKEKGVLLQKMDNQGTIILNNDDKYVIQLKRLCKRKKCITYGMKARADYRITDYHINVHNHLVFTVNKRHSFYLRTSFLPSMFNALAAISCGRLFKISYNNIQSALRRVTWPEGRFSLQNSRGYQLINDTYNANPLSFAWAIDTVSALQSRGRKVLVCADMLELGSRSALLHRKVGRHAGSVKMDAVFSLGSKARDIVRGAKRTNQQLTAKACHTRRQLHQALKQFCCKGDVILVKGSRAMQMEKTFDFLKQTLR